MPYLDLEFDALYATAALRNHGGLTDYFDVFVLIQATHSPSSKSGFCIFLFFFFKKNKKYHWSPKEYKIGYKSVLLPRINKKLLIS